MEPSNSPLSLGFFGKLALAEDSLIGRAPVESARKPRPKYAVIIPDGAADEPLDELGGQTPLEAARMETLRGLAKLGRMGTTNNLPEQLPAGSDVALMSILGCDPRRYYTGRAPIEAASQGIPLNEGDLAFRCNLVTIADDQLADYSAGEISTEEARALIQFLQEKLGSRKFQFYPGFSYRNLLVAREASYELRTVPPHDIMGQPIEPNLPEGDGAEKLIQLMWDSRELLERHETNRSRIDRGLKPGNMIWLWGQGRAPSLPSFQVQRGVTGCVIAAVDLMKGLGKLAGMAAPEVPGATGNLKTDFAAKGRTAVGALRRYDFVLVHIEAPDEAGHHADIEGKVWSLEQIDRHIVAPVWAELESYQGPKRMLVLPDHFTPVRVRTHVRRPVPYLLVGTDISAGGSDKFCEREAEQAGNVIDEGHRLIGELFLP
jgi:2,3-bisphosphoglycerate-independent phosphoglycerate mutase